MWGMVSSIWILPERPASCNLSGSPYSFRKCDFTALSFLGPCQCCLYYLLSLLTASAVALWVLALMASVFLCSVYSWVVCFKGIFRIISNLFVLKWCVLLHARYFMACKLSHRCSHSVSVLHSPVYFRNSAQLLCLINLLFVTTVQCLRYMCVQFFPFYYFCHGR